MNLLISFPRNEECFILLYVHECFACIHCVYSAHGGWKRVSDPRELEFQMVMGHHVGAEN